MYLNDSIIKCKKEENLIPHLRETFWKMRNRNMRRNTKKCVFGIRSGKFLGFMVSQRGIDANPAKGQAVLNLAEPKSKKDVMRPTEKMVDLSRFIAKRPSRQRNPCHCSKCSGEIRLLLGRGIEESLSRVKESPAQPAHLREAYH